MMSRALRTLVVRNIVFGIEDSLVSTLGLLAGVATAGVPRTTIVLTGMILIAVEAFSMGMGSLLTEHSVEEMERRRDLPMARAALGGLIMFVSYLLAGGIPLFPYIVLATDTAFVVSIAATLVALFLLGMFAATEAGTRKARHGMEMLILGGAALAVGVLVGRLVQSV